MLILALCSCVRVNYVFLFIILIWKWKSSPPRKQKLWRKWFKEVNFIFKESEFCIRSLYLAESWSVINPYQANVLILCPWNQQKNICFSAVFRGWKMRPSANRLNNYMGYNICYLVSFHSITFNFGNIILF